MARLLRLLVLGTTLALAAPVMTTASTPAASTVTVPGTAGATVPDSWSGTAPVGTNPGSTCFPGGTPLVDEHAATIVVAPGTYTGVKAQFTFSASWTPASGDPTTSDLILTLIGPDGMEIASSDTSSQTEVVTANNLPAGAYRVVVCGFVNTAAQPYAGSLAITTAANIVPPNNVLPAAGKTWGKPVKVTPTNGFGYEPSFVVDRYGNAFATAHKENWQLALAPDANSPTYTRSMSWAWLSSDSGRTWKNPPGLTPASVEQHLIGDEGDMATDDAGHVYYADTYAGDITLTRWSTNGLGKVTYDFTRPLLPTPEDDDRPWLTAHGNGHVFYFANAGNKTYDGGRYTVHTSYDGGLTWDVVGIALADSGWCRPAADHRPGSKLVYAFCTNDGGKLYSFVSTDDGHTWNRYDVGTYNNADGTQSYPSLEVAPDGTLWCLYVDSTDLDDGGTPNTNRLYLFMSTDQGKTFSKQEITPVAGRYQYGWLSISPDGKTLGLGIYYRPNASYPWSVGAVTWKTGSKPSAKAFVDLDSTHPVAPQQNAEPPGDYLGSYFFPDGKLGVIWTRIVLWTDATTLERDIYFARQS
ncbi:MAG TPA: exo-alpha-sialidase [Candidatus Limnocylindrales bacterium]|nr:exo-alpha-sialidase [Candidatus Limnocylindrales bacterium]